MSISKIFTQKVMAGTNTKAFKELASGILEKRVKIERFPDDALPTLKSSRGISEMRCLYNPETGSKDLTLYSQKGEILQDFKLSDPIEFEKAGEYFRKANERFFNILEGTKVHKKWARAAKSFEKLCGNIDDRITTITHGTTYEDFWYEYSFDGHIYTTLYDARNAAIRKYCPELVPEFDAISKDLPDYLLP